MQRCVARRVDRVSTLQEKKAAIAEKFMVEKELDIAKDDLELVVNMVPNPLAKQKNPTENDKKLTMKTRR